MTSAPTTTVTQGVTFGDKKHKSVCFLGDLGYLKKLCVWNLRYKSETQNAWAFSSKMIPRGEKVQLRAVGNSICFCSNVNNLHPAFSLGLGYFTFIDQNPLTKLSKEQIEGEESIKGFDEPENNLRVKFEKGRIYQFWISPNEWRMYCAKVPIEGEGEHVILHCEMLDHFENKERFWLMMRATPGMHLEFVD